MAHTHTRYKMKQYPTTGGHLECDNASLSTYPLVYWHQLDSLGRTTRSDLVYWHQLDSLGRTTRSDLVYWHQLDSLGRTTRSDLVYWHQLDSLGRTTRSDLVYWHQLDSLGRTTRSDVVYWHMAYSIHGLVCCFLRGQAKRPTFSRSFYVYAVSTASDVYNVLIPVKGARTYYFSIHVNR